MSPVGKSEGVLQQPTPHSAWTTMLLLPWKLLWSIILPHCWGDQATAVPSLPWALSEGTWLDRAGEAGRSLPATIPGSPWAVMGWGHPSHVAGTESPGKCWQGVSGAICRQTQLPRGQGLHAAWPPTNINHFLIYNMNN